MIARDGTFHLRMREKDSDRRSSGLLESMSQLQDARFSKSRSKDLHAHGQLSVDPAAGYGDPRDSRQ